MLGMDLVFELVFGYFLLWCWLKKEEDINFKNGNEIEYFFNYFGNLNKVNWFYDNGWKWLCL